MLRWPLQTKGQFVSIFQRIDNLPEVGLGYIGLLRLSYIGYTYVTAAIIKYMCNVARTQQDAMPRNTPPVVF